MKERKSKEFMEVEDRILLKCFHVKEPLINYCLRSPSRMVQYVPVLGSNSADIWSVGCTIIEMATGKPPWNQQQFEEVSALFHDGTTMPHPPIPDFLSSEAKSFLLKCLQKEPNLRPTASELLQDPFLSKKPPSQHRSDYMDHNLSGRGDMPESSYDSAIDPNKLQRPLPEFVDPLSAFCASFGGNSVPGWGVMPESSYNFAINPNRFHKPLPEFVDPLSAFCATFGRNLVPGRGALPESSDNSGH